MRLNKRMRWIGGSAVVLMLATMVALFGPGMLNAEAGGKTITFKMVPTNADIAACLPHASATVTVKNVEGGQRMTVEVKGLVPETDYDLFVTQVPHAAFGVSWYQSDLHTDRHGNGEAKVRGIFSNETFSISPATLTTNGREGNPQTGATFGAVNQYHLGLWFNDPNVPFQKGCEPGKTSPVVTPFNGEQHAGVQVLNTSNFADNNGPLKQLSN